MSGVDGFNFDELDEWIDEVGATVAGKVLDKENKKWIKKQANKLKTKEKKMYQSLGIGLEPTDTPHNKKIINRFKSGKTYMYGDKLSCRAYNSAPHCHLFNNGFVHKPHGNKLFRKRGEQKWIPGYHFIEKAGDSFKTEFEADAESLAEEITKIIEK